MTYLQKQDPSAFLQREDRVVEICVVNTEGSAPREVGAWMLVSGGDVFGTIGGGALEFSAISTARDMLAAANKEHRRWTPLGPETGQCCGGRVELRFRFLDDAARAALCEARREELRLLKHVYIFGAGHVGEALARALSLAPLRPVLIDTRKDVLATRDSIERRLSILPEAEIHSAAPAAGFVIATHDHALDFLLTAEALKRGDAGYVGMIGSKTKRARFERWFVAEHHNQRDLLKRLICPIGAAALRAELAKRPEVIAALTAAEVLERLLGE